MNTFQIFSGYMRTVFKLQKIFWVSLSNFDDICSVEMAVTCWMFGEVGWCRCRGRARGGLHGRAPVLWETCSTGLSSPKSHHGSRGRGVALIPISNEETKFGDVVIAKGTQAIRATLNPVQGPSKQRDLCHHKFSESPLILQ